MDKATTAAIISEAVRKFVQDAVPKDSKASTDEVDAVVRLCLLGVHRTGTEDPRAMAKSVSDHMLEHLVKNLKKTAGVPAMAMAAQFFVIEWCHRNGHLEEDWRWEWEGSDSGRILYNAKIPLESIAMPS